MSWTMSFTHKKKKIQTLCDSFGGDFTSDMVIF